MYSRRSAIILSKPGHLQITGPLVCDDFSGYKALFRQGVTEAGCMAHARRKFHELWANHSSQIAGEALKLFGILYDVEREIQALDADLRRNIRQQQGRPAADALCAWLQACPDFLS